jgi:hypothetical protein
VEREEEEEEEDDDGVEIIVKSADKTSLLVERTSDTLSSSLPAMQGRMNFMSRERRNVSDN